MNRSSATFERDAFDRHADECLLAESAQGPKDHVLRRSDVTDYNVTG